MPSFANSNHSIAHYPSQGERLASYTERLNQTLSQLEEWSSTHVSWWTHRSSGSCWICDSLLMSRILCDIMKDICVEMKNVKFIAEHPKGSTNPEYFTFKNKGKC